MKSNKSYWGPKHKYTRRSVEDIETFCGWHYLINLTESAIKDRDRALISLLFETGGRVNEVLKLAFNNFVFLNDVIVVAGMPVLKRFEFIKVKGKRTGKTKPKKKFRTFPIKRIEPLVRYFENYVKAKQGFKTIFKIGRKRVYQIVTGLDSNIWPHWLRAQRASQLALEYGLNTHALVEYFEWIDLKTALHYSRFGWRGLAFLMGIKKIDYESI